MNQRWTLFIIILCFWVFVELSWAQGQVEQVAPSRLPNVKGQMLSAGYWIAKHPLVDKPILTPSQIVAFNGDIRKRLQLTKDIFSLIEHFQTESLMDVLKGNLKNFTEKGYYTRKGIRNDVDFIEKAKINSYLSAVVLGTAPRYGLIVQFADQRFLPIQEGLYAQKGDIDFDELQNSGLDVGTPVAVVHKSKDGRWVYVLSGLSDGWVEIDRIAFTDMDTVKSFSQSKDFVVITSARADIYLDEKMTQFHAYTRMGVRLPLLQDNEHQWIVQLPLKEASGQLKLTKGYIPKSQAHQGYLPYTPRTIYTQAFLMLDKPYGWGDMYAQQDCSRFLQMVYATVGLELPRDSKDQAQVGHLLASFDEKTSEQEKLEVLQGALGAGTILAMKGHILLYLGMEEDKPFAIHETSGYGATRIPVGSQDKQKVKVKYVLNRVVVSDLSLGDTSAKGSLLRRLSKIVEIK